MFGFIKFSGKGSSNVSLRTYAKMAKAKVKNTTTRYKDMVAGFYEKHGYNGKLWEVEKKVGTKAEIKKGNYEVHSSGRRGIGRLFYGAKDETIKDCVNRYENGKLYQSTYKLEDGSVWNFNFYSDGKQKSVDKLYANGKGCVETYHLDGTLDTVIDYDECREVTSVTEFNKDGLVDSFTEYDYAEDGIETQVVSKTLYEYDDKGFRCGEKVFDAENNLVSESKYACVEIDKPWNKGLIAEKTEYHKDGQVKEHIEYYDNGVERINVQYDEAGVQISATLRGPDGTIKKSVSAQTMKPVMPTKESEGVSNDSMYFI